MRQPYPPQFQQAWDEYPPRGRQRSNKRASLKVWNRLKLSSPQVLAWIRALRDSPEWTAEGGQYVPAMGVWLKKPDFSEAPPVEAARSPRDKAPPAASAVEQSAREFQRTHPDWTAARCLSRARAYHGGA